MSRSWVSVVFVLCAVFALGSRAYAGATSTPINTGVCASLDPTENMNDPNTTGFNNASSVKACIKLCDAAAAQCHAFAKRALGCFTAWVNQAAAFERANCAIISSTPADLKSCDAGIAEEKVGFMSKVKAGYTSGLTDCDSWKSVCESTCAPM
ncbi:MAG TPA: hypothetical protein VMR31_01960 [Myxococcota bacterium]|nr:hypothetical protein [Myxococcota bacterium]